MTAQSKGSFKEKFKKHAFTIAIIYFSLMVLGYFGAILMDKWERQALKKPKMYCYENFRGPVNLALFVKDKKNIDSLIKFYQAIEHGDRNPTFNFPPLLAPSDTCAYILEYSNDSLIAKVRFFTRRDIYDGFVYVHTLHKEKRSLTRKFKGGLEGL